METVVKTKMLPTNLLDWVVGLIVMDFQFGLMLVVSVIPNIFLGNGFTTFLTFLAIYTLFTLYCVKHLVLNEEGIRFERKLGSPKNYRGAK